jgi:hypothetical protein
MRQRCDVLESRNSAKEILSVLPDIRNRFFFYTDLNKPTGEVAQSLEEFSSKLKTIDINSIRFHLARGDFERWFAFIGDGILSGDIKRVSTILNYNDEELRTVITDLVERRINELKAQL